MNTRVVRAVAAIGMLATSLNAIIAVYVGNIVVMVVQVLTLALLAYVYKNPEGF